MHIGKEFLSKTRYPFLTLSLQKQGQPQPPLELPLPPGEVIPLPKPAEVIVPAMDLRTAIEQRVTHRQYSSDGISMEELSFLLWCTQGIRDASNPKVTMRTVPSAGARHPLETILLVNNVAGLKSGLYRYAASQHGLVKLEAPADVAQQLSQACLQQKHVLTSAVTFFWVAVAERTFWRYSERSYRYFFLDAGHVCQNLYLAAEAIDCGVCAIGAYDDDLTNQLLGVDGDAVFTVYGATLGKKGR
ncbi:MAG TPA: SagB/ThcOx family dehydrogenase [Anaerolineaceae bacterium]|nr:SagB/ThcOx family dehydrogenase [Anaerolineaceae bacterium]HPN51730.1 SagB/ThcOx family dehydrogenase [Anaerolineaceae bacterium]